MSTLTVFNLEMNLSCELNLNSEECLHDSVSGRLCCSVGRHDKTKFSFVLYALRRFIYKM